MRAFRALLAAGLAALAISAGSAGATASFSITSGSFTAISNGALTFEGGGRRVACNLTLSGSFYARTIEARSGSPVGDVTSATLAGCAGVTLLGPSAERPWQLKYDSIEGAAPDAVEAYNFRLSGFAASVTAFGTGCLYSGEPSTNAVAPAYEETPGTYEVRSFRFTTNSESKVSGEASCPATMNVAGTFDLSQHRLIIETTVISWIGGGPRIDFGNQTVGAGTTWYATEVEIRNNSATALTAREVRIYIWNYDRFRASGFAPNDVIGANGGTKRFRVLFNPTIRNVPLRSWLYIYMTDRQVYGLSMRGMGI